jgi:hypothetical protein
LADLDMKSSAATEKVEEAIEKMSPEDIGG